jgi:hypothetical protein
MTHSCTYNAFIDSFMHILQSFNHLCMYKHTCTLAYTSSHIAIIILVIIRHKLGLQSALPSRYRSIWRRISRHISNELGHIRLKLWGGPSPSSTASPCPGSAVTARLSSSSSSLASAAPVSGRKIKSDVSGREVTMLVSDTRIVHAYANISLFFLQ